MVNAFTPSTPLTRPTQSQADSREQIHVELHQQIPDAIGEVRTALQALIAGVNTDLAGKVPESTFIERVQDAVAALIAGGTGVTVSYDDANNRLTLVAAAGGGSTDPEVVRDTIGVALAGVGLMSVVANDTADTITITTTATANSTDAQLRDRSTHSGTQAIATVSGLQTALDQKAEAAALATKLAAADLEAVEVIEPGQLDALVAALLVNANSETYRALRAGPFTRVYGPAVYSGKTVTAVGNTGTDADGSTNWSDADSAYSWNSQDGAAGSDVGLVANRRPSTSNLNYFRFFKTAVPSRQSLRLYGAVGTSSTSTVRSPMLILRASNIPTTTGGVEPDSYYAAYVNGAGLATISRVVAGVGTTLATATAPVGSATPAVGDMIDATFYVKATASGSVTLAVTIGGVEAVTATEASGALTGGFVGTMVRRNAAGGVSPLINTAEILALG